VTLKRNTCECGCGTPTRLAPYSDRSKGWVAGEPVRFITGHNMFAKRRGYVIEDRGYETPCWIWQGVPSGDNGYGRMRVDRRARPAHRVYYEQIHGAIPDEMQLDHLCRVPLCVNPGHLEPVTGTENVRRGNVAKLSVEAAAEIRAFRDRFFAEHPLNDKGAPRKRFPQGVLGQLAAEYGVSKTTIISVLKDRTWR
jgi:hypothetical protein